MKTKVIHLHLKEPINGKADYYYGSVIAIYDEFPHDMLGITYKSLLNALQGKSVYENKRCVIRIGELIRKKKQN